MIQENSFHIIRLFYFSVTFHNYRLFNKKSDCNRIRLIGLPYPSDMVMGVLAGSSGPVSINNHDYGQLKTRSDVASVFLKPPEMKKLWPLG